MQHPAKGLDTAMLDIHSENMAHNYSMKNRALTRQRKDGATRRFL